MFGEALKGHLHVPFSISFGPNRMHLTGESPSGMWRAERQSTHHLLASPIFVHSHSLVTVRGLCQVQIVGHFEYGMYEKVLCYTNFLGVEWLKYFQSCNPRMTSRFCRDLQTHLIITHFFGKFTQLPEE